MKKRWWNFVRKHKKIVFVFFIIFIILLTFFSAQIALFFNFVIGNDIVVKLKVSPEYISLVHGQKESIAVEASVTTNPFCKAACSSQFEDISDKNILDNVAFTIRPSDPFQHQYEITAPLIGEGMKVYRFGMECQSVQTILCHTSEEPSTRNVLIIVEYGLTDKEKELRSVLQQQLQAILRKVSALEWKNTAYEDLLLQMKVMFKPVSASSPELLALHASIKEVESLWHEQDFNALIGQISEINMLLSQQEQQDELFTEKVTALVQRYNTMIENVLEAGQWLELFSKYDTANTTARTMMNATAAEFNSLISLLSQLVPFEQKENATYLFSDKVKALTAAADMKQSTEILKKEVEADINYDLLCDLAEICYQHPSLSARANQTEFSLNQTCENSNLLRIRVIEANLSFHDEFTAQVYPGDDSFASNISAQLFNLQQLKIQEYYENIPKNKTNTHLLTELLVEQPLRAVEQYQDYNLTPVLVAELTTQLPASCTALPVVISEPSLLNLTIVEIPAAIPVTINFTFTEPAPRCCVFGECRACCTSVACNNDPSTYPVVFIHGHAVSKDTSFEYSLEGFNQLQKKLEEEGYLSAGAITLYTSRDVPEGIWGKLPVPVSIRASYYSDLFQQPENYVVVQTKSENIDTYAVRLKEVIDIIQYKTGKSKVNVVAFSMGSLVSRRYIQIFGTQQVNKLILIGAPNKGIAGKVADYCSVTGEQRECLDMNAESLFINKLNRGALPGIPTYNIVGTGCDMNGKQGDGVVLEDHAYLEGAQNFIVNGTCESVAKPLHLQLRNIKKYPPVYEAVSKALKE